MKVYYDDKCKVYREIKFYKKFGVKNIDWIGILLKCRNGPLDKKKTYLKTARNR